ncbi:hypothetical protein [Burkholderia multivorans]|uniref:hypothetical protein n=1 Tax=Burkholderia multivorans TaxID=87883 RepID=UPI00158C9DFA|nr:hypothetical protein [Burkholderia multivorans]
MEQEEKWVPKKPYHYVYLMLHTETGLFYIGVRSSYAKPELDLYFGSGALLWEVYNDQGYFSIKQGQPTGWEKHIVVCFDNRIEADRYENKAIRGEVDNPLCLNCVGTKKARLNRISRDLQ